MMRVSMLFLLAYFWCFQPHRYGKAKSLLILAVCYAATTFPDMVFDANTIFSVTKISNFAAVFNLLVVSITAFVFGVHRDDRTVLTVITACTYELTGISFNSIIYCHTGRNSAISLAAQIVFMLTLLLIMKRNDRRVSMSEMLDALRDRWKLCIVTAMNFVSVYAASVWPGNVVYSELSRVLTVIMIALTLAYYLVVFSLMNAQMKGDRLEMNNEFLETYAAGLERQLEKDMRNQETMSIIRHDMRHRESMILYYLDSGDTDLIRDMLISTSEKMSKTAEKRYSLNPELNILLADTALKASENDTRFECRCEVEEIPKFIMTELMTVVLNLLENAQKAASAIPEKDKRFISFSMIPVGSQVEIEVDNSYTGELELDKNTGLPLARSQNGHGYGLRSVLAFSGKYHVPYTCETDGGVFRIRMLVLIQYTD